MFSPKAKYIYIARDGRDVVWSFFNHHYHMNDVFYDGLKALPYLGPLWERPRTSDPREYFFDWFNREGFPLWPFWENIRTWWEVRDLPNVHLIHYQDLKDDMEGRIREIAAFLDIPIDESKWGDMVDHCSFDYMKNHAPLSTPLEGVIFDGGAQVFINKGINGRWRDMLTKEDCEAYEGRAIEELGPECAHWLATGERPR